MRFIKKQVERFKEALSLVSPLVLALYVVSLVSMNLLANKEIYTGDASRWLAIDCGTTLSWVAFFLTNIITKKAGPAHSIRISFIALVINLLFCVWFWLVSKIPGNWGAYYEFEQGVVNDALNFTLEGSWQIILGSAFAFFVSISANSLLNYTIFKRVGKSGLKGFLVSNYLSVGISQFIDNLLFAELVSVSLFGWSQLQCFVCACTGALVELLFELLFSGASYKAYKRLLGGDKNV